MKKQHIKISYIVALIITAFLLHVIWENAQAPLFVGYQSFSQHLAICLIGTLGDVVITLLTLALVWLLKKDIPSTKADFLALAIIGLMIAIAIEQNALLLDKWNYTSAMPLLPYLQVGLLPILQMTFLLPFSFYLAKLINAKLEKLQLKEILNLYI